MVKTSLYRCLLDVAQTALLIIQSDGTPLEANKAACKLFGYTEKEFKALGQKGLHTLTGLSPDIFQQKPTNGILVKKSTGIRKNNNQFAAEITLYIDTDDSNYAVLVKDISEYKVNGLQLEGLPGEMQKTPKQEADSRAIMKNVLNNITDGFIIIDRNWDILFWNKAAETILGKNETDLLGKNIWEEFPELEVLKLHKNYQILLEEKKSIRFREYFPSYKVWADVSVYPSEHTISVYFKDVTEVKNLQTLQKLEREVLEMNAKQDIPFEKALDFYLLELEKLHPGMNCSVLRLQGNQLFNWSSPSLPQRYTQAINGALIGENQGSCGTAAYLMEKVVVADISRDFRWAEYKHLALREGLKACWSFPIIDSANNIMGTFAIYYNRIKTPTPEEESTLERAKNLLTIIIENKLSLEAVKESNRSYDLVALATNDAIWDWDLTTNKVVRTGMGLKILFGYEQAEADADLDFWMKRVHPDDKKWVITKQREFLDNPVNQYWEEEYRFRKINGEYAYVFDRGYIIRNEEGKAIRMIGATRDITERKQNEALLLELNNKLKQRADELAASNVELERFAYIASHDMQEPLRMISSFLQLFRKKYEGQLDETAEQYIHYAVDGADRMKRLIKDLLEYSKVGSSKENYEEVNTYNLVNEVVNVFLDRLEEMKGVITIDNLPQVLANKTQLFQLFQNLIGNALKYAGNEPPRILIQGVEASDHYQFSIRDNGIGIKPVFFEKIFVLFQRLHHKNEYGGTGIGLAVCKKIVERHKGRIWLESEPGKGSCFYFTISKLLEDPVFM